MGGDSHHHSPIPKVPNWNIYKVEDVPQLKKVQEKLATEGLKDPWLRNEVWRYNPKEFGTFGSRLSTFLLRGARLGIPAFLLTIGATSLYDSIYPPAHGHHH